MSANILNLPAALGALILKWATAKYIEGAGATSADMLARAQSVKTLATALDQAALGGITLAQLATMAAADLTKANVPISTQVLINGLIALIASAVPTGNLITAALGAQADIFLKDVIATCTTFGA
jgi:hypothetical protein